MGKVLQTFAQPAPLKSVLCSMLPWMRLGAMAVLFAWTVGLVHDAIPHVHGEPAHHVCAEVGVWDVLLHLVDHHAAGVPCDDHHDMAWKQGALARAEGAASYEAVPPLVAVRLQPAVPFVPGCTAQATPHRLERTRVAHEGPAGERGPPVQG